MKKVILSCVLLALFSCENQEITQPPIFKIEKIFEPFVKIFIDEAQKRGKTIVLENLIINFGKTSNGACGECEILKKGNLQRTIRIDTTESLCWNRTAELNREALILHELGHCLLNRPHRSDLSAKKTPVSIMYPSPIGLYEPCQYSLGAVSECDKRYRRQHYLDELFDDKTPFPSW